VKTRLLLASIAALVLVLAVRWQFPDDRGNRINADLPDPRFDYTLTEFTASFRNEDGQLELILSGPRLEHDAASRVATIQSPTFHIDPDGADWQGRASQGRLLRDADELLLEGSVVLEHTDADGTMQMTSDQLRHSLGQRTIESPGPAQMRGPHSLIDAGRVTVRLDDDTVEFFNHVQGELLPRRTDRQP
jgi:LPS export ABC transporter protein LptC